MKRLVLTCITIGLAILLAAGPASSQRSASVDYDNSRQVRLQGIVTKIDWVNPHAYFYIEVRDAAKTVTNWAIEFGNPIDLERDGWRSSSLRIGEVVTVEGIPVRAG